jgi:hypothetical protein
MAAQAGDFSTATRCEELKGKYLAMFTDKQETTLTDGQDGQFSLGRLSRLQISGNDTVQKSDVLSTEKAKSPTS